MSQISFIFLSFSPLFSISFCFSSVFYFFITCANKKIYINLYIYISILLDLSAGSCHNNILCIDLLYSVIEYGANFDLLNNDLYSWSCPFCECLSPRFVLWLAHTEAPFTPAESCVAAEENKNESVARVKRDLLCLLVKEVKGPFFNSLFGRRCYQVQLDVLKIYQTERSTVLTLVIFKNMLPSVASLKLSVKF